jgi:hypothetical protein
MPFRYFTGEFAFDAAEALCAVARPYSGDVLLLETTTFRVTHRVTTGRQPLGVGLLPNGRVVARDWTSGELLLAGDWEPFSL